jgi:hypothetical protein
MRAFPIVLDAPLGHSPDLAEALMLALGEPAYEPYRYTGLPRLPTSSPFDSAARRATCQAQGDTDDAAGDATFFVNDPLQMRLPPGANSRRWGRSTGERHGEFARVRYGFVLTPITCSPQDLRTAAFNAFTVENPYAVAAAERLPYCWTSAESLLRSQFDCPANSWNS